MEKRKKINKGSFYISLVSSLVYFSKIYHCWGTKYLLLEINLNQYTKDQGTNHSTKKRDAASHKIC